MEIGSAARARGAKVAMGKRFILPKDDAAKQIVYDVIASMQPLEEHALSDRDFAAVEALRVRLGWPVVS